MWLVFVIMERSRIHWIQEYGLFTIFQNVVQEKRKIMKELNSRFLFGLSKFSSKYIYLSKKHDTFLKIRHW